MATYTESFDAGADGIDLADGTLDLTWAHVEGTSEWETNQGAASPEGADRGLVTFARAEHDSDTSDTYAQVSVTALLTGSQGGPCLRYSASANTCYFVEAFGNGDIWIQKVIAGTRSTVATGTGVVSGLPKTLRLEAEGDTLTAFWDGVQVAQGVDTGIVAGTRGGLTGFESSGEALGIVVDNFEFGDLGGAPAAAGGGLTVAEALNIAAGTSGLTETGAANALAGTTGLTLAGALNAHASTSGLTETGAANAAAGTDNLTLTGACNVLAEAA